MKNEPTLRHRSIAGRLLKHLVILVPSNYLRHKPAVSFRFIKTAGTADLRTERSTAHLLNAIFLITTTTLLSFSISACSSSFFVGLKSLKSQLGVPVLPGRAEYPDADAVVLSSLHDVDVYQTNDGKIVTDVAVTKIIKLLRNVDENASVQIPVYSGDKIFSLRARIIEPDGSSIPLAKTDFHRIIGAGSDYVFYSDEQKVRFTFPDVQRNSIIEYHYVIHELHPFIEDVWQVQSMYPELHNEYRLTLPAKLLVSPQDGGYGWNWRYKAYNCKLGPPVFRKNPDTESEYVTVTLTWSKNNVPAFKPDPMMPPYLDYMAYVKFSPSQWKTWDDISGWYYRFLFKPQLDITPAISAKARKLTDGCSTQKQKIEKIFDFVQTLRYVAVELGRGGYVPSKPGTVLKRMYGDCKDESILLVSLLRSAGITAKPVLVLTSDEGVLDPAFPTWMFNHMIVKAITADGSSYWLDPTAGHCGLGEIPYDDRGTNVLVLNSDNTSEIERIPLSSFAQNVENISADVTIGDSGAADFSVGMRFKGQENLATRDELAGGTRDELSRSCKSLVADNYLNAEVTSCSLDNADNPDTPLTLHFKLKVPNALQTQGKMILLNIDPFRISGDWSWLAHDHRTYDIQFDYPHVITKTINVKLPAKYKLMQLPATTVDSTAGLFFSKSYMRVDSTRFDVTETFAITSKTIDHRDFKSVKRFAERMRDAEKEMILLSR